MYRKLRRTHVMDGMDWKAEQGELSTAPGDGAVAQPLGYAESEQ